MDVTPLPTFTAPGRKLWVRFPVLICGDIVDANVLARVLTG